MSWYSRVWQHYFDFAGRASRREFWMFTLYNMLVIFALSVITALVHPLAFMTWLYGLAVFMPSLALQFRRLHDVGRSGWWLLISAVPLIGAIVLLVFFVLPSEPMSNNYGSVPPLSA
ncbi:MAG: DUF805 domain-containing protein [Sulfobacillus thermosulfidooxidans]|uniref:DUF805 domain-containing protein n=1 Tax=Sulfobacillus thermotolerans TaxID=338644 RepID=A0ABN5GWN3_9FIRM|nr:DUF805 domain-containing protein [Sulfobacillus sp. hq2]AUW92749.1 hypothetical protein BXT84_01255 [Sulfobacillus thermotolerans]POB10180.1 hypothetical protein CO251_11190 [Sulfobacillus sp. hq2]PSR37018.1 MAG: DUF805 domain-containing protein [Sulfobacillus thermosulfidooxidans]